MRVLVVDDDNLPRLLMTEAMQAEGYDVVAAGDVPSARRLLPECDVAVIDLILPGESGLALLSEAVHADQAALVVTAGTSAAEQVEAMRRGAYDVLNKPVSPALLVRAVSRAAERVRLARENRRLVARLEGRAKDLEHERTALVAEVENRAELLARAKVEWEDTFDAIEQPIVVLDSSLRVVRSNRAFAAAAGAPTEALLGRPCHEALFAQLEPCDGCPVAGEHGTRARELRRGDRIVRVSAFSGRIGRGTHVVIHDDVTEQRHLAARLSHAERLAAIARLGAGVAHEINNPMASITANLRSVRRTLERARSCAATAAEPELAEDLSDSIDAVAESASSADRVTSIVAALRHIAGDASTDLVPVKVDESLERAAERARRAVGPGARVELIWELGASARALADPVRLDHACFELLKNALQASPSGATVRVRTFDEPDRVGVEILDEGSGIPQALHRRVGEAFFTSCELGAGRGLGLAIASGIVRQMGGGLELHPLGEKGTSAVFKLPVAPRP